MGFNGFKKETTAEPLKNELGGNTIYYHIKKKLSS